ncbi:Long chain base biosynthesis protein 2b [Phytophthora citrophthora]|uniref:Long chain base biosynthesis protein 2b n=1 Tax=Phytophthora citrophthora TaxID=4793 RepID=A0AAD9GNG3_9STRA|nr:Long chain base biosynthesis protein 2b [Phytophthora citrophthora]
MAAEHVPWAAAILCYIQYAILITFGHLRDHAGSIFGGSRYSDNAKKGYAPLLVAFENFYTKRIYHRLQDVFNRPVAGSPGGLTLLISIVPPS